MQKLLLSVLALVLALGAVLTFVLLRSDDGEAAGAAEEQVFAGEPASEAPGTEGSVVDSRATEEGPDPRRPFSRRTGERVSALVELEDVGERRTWDAAVSVFVAGRVVVPPTCPVEEAFEVFAYEGDSDPADRVRDFPFSADPDDDLVPTGFLARMQVDPIEAGGAFRLGLPPDVESAWLVVRGTYLYSKVGVRVDLSGDAPTALLEPSVGAWISGTLVPPADATAEQRAMEGLAVRLSPERLSDLRGVGGLGPDAPPSRGATVASDLTFELRGVQAGVAYTVGALPELLASARSEKFQPRAGEHAHVKIVLTHGAMLSGRVVDESGDPVEGAELEVRVGAIIFGQGGVVAREAKSAADGTFLLAAVPVGDTRIDVESEGFIPGSKDLSLLEGQVVDDIELVLGRGRRVTGRVVWADGGPAVGANVELTFDMSQMGGMAAFNAMSGAEGTAEADEDGAFVITGLGNGPFTVRASLGAGRRDGVTIGGDDEGPLWQARADGVRPDPDEIQDSERLQLELEPPIGFAGRVLDSLGQPVTEFTLHARTQEGGLFAAFGSDTHSAGFEEEDGAFFLDGLRNGEWLITAASEGFGSQGALTVLLPRPDDAEPVELMLYRLATISGVVLDPEGRPVGGADVGRQQTVQEMRRTLDGDDSERATTDKDGRFTIEGITPGNISLAADARDFAESEPVAVEIEPSGSADGIVITLRVGGRLVGEIYDADGKPEAGRAILAQRPSAIGLQRWGRSDAEGHFTIEHLVPGKYQVMTMPDQKTVEGERSEDDYTSIFAEMRLTMADIRDDEETFVQLGSPPGDPVRVRGKVELAGDGVPGVMVNFVPDGAEGTMRFATTDEAGKYEVELAAAGRYMISMQKVGGTGQSQSLALFEQIPETLEHRLNLTLPVGRITGRVIGANGAPAVKERVTLFSGGSRMDGNYAETQTDDEGRYDLTWLRGGTYNVAAGGVFLGGVIGNPTGNGRQVKSDVRVREGEWLRDVDFRMREAGRVEGLVVDETGSPLPEASIYLFAENGQRIEPFSTTVTDGTGRFEYEGVQPGSYTVRARAGGRATPEPVPVRVGEGQTAQAELKVETGTTLILKLVDESGQPLQAGVEVFDENEQEVGGMLSLAEILEIFMQGNFSSTEPRVGPLTAGRYRVVAESADGRKATKMVTLRGQDERSLKLRLK